MPAAPPRLLLLRHGESRGQWAGAAAPADDPLGAAGRAQARAVATALAAAAALAAASPAADGEEYTSVDVIVASPLRRALQTALLAFPRRRVRVDPRLREFNYLQRAGAPLLPRHAGSPYARLRADAAVGAAAAGDDADDADVDDDADLDDDAGGLRRAGWAAAAAARVEWPDLADPAAGGAWWEPHGDAADAQRRVREFAREVLVPLAYTQRLRVAVVAHENVFRVLADTLELPNATAMWASLTPAGHVLLQRSVPAAGWPAPGRCLLGAADKTDVAALAPTLVHALRADPQLLAVLALPDISDMRATHGAVYAALDAVLPGPRRESCSAVADAENAAVMSPRAALVSRIVVVLDAGAGAASAVQAALARLTPAAGPWPAAPSSWHLTLAGTAARVAALAASCEAPGLAVSVVHAVPPSPLSAPVVSLADRVSGVDAALALASDPARAARLVETLPALFAVLGRQTRAAALLTIATGPPVVGSDVGSLLDHLEADDAPAAMALLARVPLLAHAPLDRMGQTALHMAARKEALTCVRLLLVCHGTALEAVTSEGFTAWHFARHAGIRAFLDFWLKAAHVPPPALPAHFLPAV